MFPKLIIELLQADFRIPFALQGRFRIIMHNEQCREQHTHKVADDTT